MSSRKIVPPCASSNRPGPVLDGPGERAALVAEQLRLDQRLGEDRAADRHERLVPPRAGLVDEVGDHLLPGAGLARHQHAAVAVGDHAHEIEHRPHAGTASDDDLIDGEGGGSNHVSGAGDLV